MSNEMMGKCNAATCCAASKKFINALIDQPILGSVFVADFFMVFFVKTAHWSFSALMVGGLVAMSMYYGQKLSLFNQAPAQSAEQTENKD